jgi:hypothetical protein
MRPRVRVRFFELELELIHRTARGGWVGEQVVSYRTAPYRVTCV